MLRHQGAFSSIPAPQPSSPWTTPPGPPRAPTHRRRSAPRASGAARAGDAHSAADAPGGAPEQKIAPPSAGKTAPWAYIDWAAEQAQRMMGVESKVAGEIDEEKAASLIQAILVERGELAEKM